MIDQPKVAPVSTEGEFYNSDRGVVDVDTAHKVGGVSIDVVARNTRGIMMGSGQFMTNLPADVNPFEDQEGTRGAMRPALNQYLRPSDMDSLPVGEYTVNGNIRDEFSWTGGEIAVERRVDVIEGKYGKAIDVDSLRADWDRDPSPGAGELLGQLGYVLDKEGLITAVPTPNTVKKAARDNFGVEIELISDEAEISAGRYVGVFGEGKYPVSTQTEGFYLHDIEDDHLTAVALGGVPLMDALQTAAHTSGKDEISLNKTSGGIDAYTVALRAVVAEFKTVIGQAYGKSEGRRTLAEIGNRIGISAETTNEIIVTAQQTAHRLGMNVQALD